MNKYKKFLLHTVETRFKTIMIGLSKGHFG